MGGVIVLGLSLARGAHADAPFDRLEAAARAAPRDVSAQIAYVEALVRAARYDDAARVAKQGARVAPRSLALHLAQARVVFARQDFRNAKRACSALQRIDPKAFETRICLAEGFVALQRSELAFQEIEKIIAEDPARMEGHLAKADALRLRMSEDAARAAYQRASELAPEDPRPHVGLGQLALAAGKKSEALAAFRRARALGADWPEVRLAFGRLTKGEVARAHLRAANEMRANWVDALAALAWAELEADALEEARALFSRAIAIDELTGGAHLGLGVTLVRLGDDTRARASLGRSLELVPTSARAWLELARLETRAKEVELALEHYRRAADHDRSDPTALLEAAALCLAHERAVVAMAFLDRVFEHEPENSRALLLYGDAKRMTRKPDEAARYYERSARGTGPVDEAGLAERLERVQ